MEKTLQSTWLIIFVLTLVLTGINVSLNKASIKFRFDKNDILNSIGFGMTFLGLGILFNLRLLNPFLAIGALIFGVILSVFIRSLNTKNEVLSGLGTFAIFLIVYKFISSHDVLLLGLFTAPAVASITASLIIKNDEFANNKLTSVAVLLPIYGSLAWLKVLDFGVEEVFTKIILVFSVVILALLSSFALSLDIKVDSTVKKTGVFIITALLTYLILNNFLTLPIKLTLFVIGGFLFANALNLLNIDSDQENKGTFFNSIAGFVLILLVGFIATRLFGTWGLLLISLCCIGALSIRSNNIIDFPVIAALFFSVKALIQAFIQTNTLNVTGLNLNHPYVYAGLLIGFALPVLILALTSQYSKKFRYFNIIVFLISALIIPLLSAYLFHAEATGALIIALSVSAFVITIVVSVIADKFNIVNAKNYSNIMLPLTGLAGIVLLNSQKIVDIGNLASRFQRIEVIIGITFIFALVLTILVKFINKSKLA